MAFFDKLHTIIFMAAPSVGRRTLQRQSIVPMGYPGFSAFAASFPCGGQGTW